MAEPKTSQHKHARALRQMSQAPNHHRRALVVACLSVIAIMLGMMAVLARVAHLQYQPPQPVAELVDSQRSYMPLKSRRGELLDRHGRVLAGNRPVVRLFADPARIENLAAFCFELSTTLGLDREALWDKLSARRDRRYVVIEHELADAQVEKLDELTATGWHTEVWLKRQYPNGQVAGQVIGFVGFEGKAWEGLERNLDERLQPHEGQLSYWRDAARRPLWVQTGDYEPPAPGEDMHLSLDLVIQTIAEEELAAACEKYEAKSGQLVVMDPATGQILAMANYPLFDPNNLSEAKADQWRNRCVTDVFEPGSIFKPFIWATATDGGFASPTEMIDCTTSGVYRSPQGRRLRDAHAHGNLSWEGVLVKSSNIGMAIVAQRMGNHRLHNAVRSFGFGEITRVELPGEVPGLVRPVEKWNHYSETSIPMGQEIGTTALQLTRAFCSLGNGGYLVQPTVLADNIKDKDHSPVFRERVIDQDVANLTRQVLRTTVLEGTGRKAKSDLYSIWGKTGTAQIASPDGKGYLEDQYVGSFVAGAPVDKPRVVIGCFIHRPNKKIGYYGGIVSAPVVKNVVERSLPYLGVEPDVPNRGTNIRQASTH